MKNRVAAVVILANLLLLTATILIGLRWKQNDVRKFSKFEGNAVISNVRCIETIGEGQYRMAVWLWVDFSYQGEHYQATPLNSAITQKTPDCPEIGGSVYTYALFYDGEFIGASTKDQFEAESYVYYELAAFGIFYLIVSAELCTWYKWRKSRRERELREGLLQAYTATPLIPMPAYTPPKEPEEPEEGPGTPTGSSSTE
jgi:hypothetical protein